MLNLLFGIDEGEKSRRVYFNYIVKNKITFNSLQY